MSKSKIVLFLAVFMIIIIGSFVTLHASSDNDLLNPDVVKIFDNQLSQEEREILTDTNNYENSVADKETLVKSTFLKIHPGPCWDLADYSFDTFMQNVRTYEQKLSFSDYLAFGNELTRICVITHEEKTSIGKRPDQDGLPVYYQDMINLSDNISIQDHSYTVKGIFCIDGVSSYAGFTTYYLTSGGIYVKYYADDKSQGAIYPYDDFVNFSIEYNKYLTSWENNYNEDGEPVGGDPLPFAEFVKDQEKLTISSPVLDEQPSSIKPWMIIAISFAVCIVIAIPLVFLLRRRRQQGHVNANPSV